MTTYTITRVSEEPRLRDGKPDADILIEYTVGTDGPFFHRLPKNAFLSGAAPEQLHQLSTALTQLRA